MLNLKGKVAIVTGASRGIGREIALVLAGAGAQVVGVGLNEERLNRVAQEIKDLGGEVVVSRTDVSKKIEVGKLADLAIDKFGKIDILVNNAAYIKYAGLLEFPEDEWDRMMAIDLKGPLFCIQAVAPDMIKRNYGKIINVSSVAGLNVIGSGQACYASAKAGLIQFTRICAIELGGYGINVNCIAPGAVLTDATHALRSGEELAKWIEGRKMRTVLGRLGTPKDIANLCLFLVSDESCWITGQVIAADGGRFSG